MKLRLIAGLLILVGPISQGVFGMVQDSNILDRLVVSNIAPLIAFEKKCKDKEFILKYCLNLLNRDKKPILNGSISPFEFWLDHLKKLTSDQKPTPNRLNVFNKAPNPETNEARNALFVDGKFKCVTVKDTVVLGQDKYMVNDITIQAKKKDDAHYERLNTFYLEKLQKSQNVSVTKGLYVVKEEISSSEKEPHTFSDEFAKKEFNNEESLKFTSGFERATGFLTKRAELGFFKKDKKE